MGAAFSLTRFSEAFLLVLRAQQTGINIAWIPGVMVVMSLAYALMGIPPESSPIEATAAFCLRSESSC